MTIGTLPQTIASEKTPSPRNISPRDKSNIARPRDLPGITGLSRTTCWRLERLGDFPKRIQLSAGAVGYRTADLLAWVASRQDVVGV